MFEFNIIFQLKPPYNYKRHILNHRKELNDLHRIFKSFQFKTPKPKIFWVTLFDNGIVTEKKLKTITITVNEDILF